MLEFSNGLTLGKELGKGAFGVVYEGLDLVRGRVAVKIFERLPIESDQDWLDRAQELLREGQRLKDAEHPRMVSVYQACASVDNEAIALVMEYCENGSLLPVYELAPMSLKDVRPLLTDIAQGLEVIHSREMLHRDLKPSNIMLDSNRRAKIGDFGLVTNDLLFGYAAGFGYQDHFAPEVFSTRLTSVRTDVWAFGMTAYRLLHGKTFYTGTPPPLISVPLGDFAKNLSWLPSVPEAWRRFIRHALHDDPAKRFQNASELLSALAKLPIEPDWRCIYSASDVAWHLREEKRTTVVRWQRRSPRDTEWIAITLNLETKKQRVIGKSKMFLSKIEAAKELQDFFIKRSR